MDSLRLSPRTLWCVMVLLGLVSVGVPTGANAHWGARSDRKRPAMRRSAACWRVTGRAGELGDRPPGRGLDARRLARMGALGADVYRRLPIIHSVALRVPTRNLGRLAALPFVPHLSSDGPVAEVRRVHRRLPAARATPYSSTGWTAPASPSPSWTAASARPAAHDLDEPAHRRRRRASSRRVSFCPATPTRTTPAATAPTSPASSPATARRPPAASITTRSTASPATPTWSTCACWTRTARAASARSSPASSGSSPTRRTYKIRVINLSLGHPVGESYTTDPLCQAVEAAWKAGIVVVCAAGNDGRLQRDRQTAGRRTTRAGGRPTGASKSPGNDPYVITVGATKRHRTASRADDQIATYSSRGPSRLDLVCKPDLVAPGNRIISLDADGSTLDNYSNGGTNDIPLVRLLRRNGGRSPSNDYFRLSGTSWPRRSSPGRRRCCCRRTRR